MCTTKPFHLPSLMCTPICFRHASPVCTFPHRWQQNTFAHIQVYVLTPHPLLRNVMLTAGYDGKVILWDLNLGKVNLAPCCSLSVLVCCILIWKRTSNRFPTLTLDGILEAKASVWALFGVCRRCRTV